MLSKHEAGNKIYRFSDNLKNFAWVSGYVFKLSSDRKSFYIRQSEYATHLYLVELAPEDYLPTAYSEGSGIKIYARLASKEVAGNNSIVLNVLFIERASMNELPAMGKTEDSEPTEFNPYVEFELEMPTGKPINNVIVAGFIDSMIFDTNEAGEIKPDCLLIGLRVGKNSILPVRNYGKRCQTEYNSIKRLKNGGKFTPVAFHSSLRSKSIMVDGAAQIITYIHTDRIKTMEPTSLGEYFMGKPLWLKQLQQNDVARE